MRKLLFVFLLTNFLLAMALCPVPAQGGKACELVAPLAPLSSQGLSSVYHLNGCSESDPDNAVFVQATIFDPHTRNLYAYNPLVVSGSNAPAVQPTLVSLPPDATVALWVGANNTVRVTEDDPNAQFVRQSGGSFFGQQAYLNVPAFLAATTNQRLNATNLVVPPLGTAVDGLPCPTARDFSIADQDPSDNTTADYLVTPNGQTAQDTPANRSTLTGAVKVVNGSDERTLDRVDAALGCVPWKVPDLADASQTQVVTAGLLQELQAGAEQAAPLALVPALDPFVTVRGQGNLSKLNLYRQQLDQPSVSTLSDADTAVYCQGLLTSGEPRLKADQQWTQPAGTPFPLLADNLFDFLAYRFNQSWDVLGCQALIGVDSPVTLTYNATGVVVGATYR